MVFTENKYDFYMVFTARALSDLPLLHAQPVPPLLLAPIAALVRVHVQQHVRAACAGMTHNCSKLPCLCLACPMANALQRCRVKRHACIPMPIHRPTPGLPASALCARLLIRLWAPLPRQVQPV